MRSTRAVSYAGVLQQALRDVSAWVEHGIAPPSSTEYEVVDGQVLVSPTSPDRGGIQAVATVRANGSSRAEVGVGEAVAFSATIEVPPGTGTIVAADWDFEGAGDFPRVTEGIDGSASRMELATTYSFAEPGTYFPALRVASHRRGDTGTAFARVLNLGRVRRGGRRRMMIDTAPCDTAP